LASTCTSHPRTSRRWAAAALLLGGILLWPALASAQPNLILINIDDLGYADISPFGGKVTTPHLDRMAQSGGFRVRRCR
jgi:hypothetical protein